VLIAATFPCPLHPYPTLFQRFPNAFPLPTAAAKQMQLKSLRKEIVAAGTQRYYMVE